MLCNTLQVWRALTGLRAGYRIRARWYARMRDPGVSCRCRFSALRSCTEIKFLFSIYHITPLVQNALPTASASRRTASRNHPRNPPLCIWSACDDGTVASTLTFSLSSSNGSSSFACPPERSLRSAVRARVSARAAVKVAARAGRN